MPLVQVIYFTSFIFQPLGFCQLWTVNCKNAGTCLVSHQDKVMEWWCDGVSVSKTSGSTTDPPLLPTHKQTHIQVKWPNFLNIIWEPECKSEWSLILSLHSSQRSQRLHCRIRRDYWLSLLGSCTKLSNNPNYYQGHCLHLLYSAVIANQHTLPAFFFFPSKDQGNKSSAENQNQKCSCTLWF